MSKSLSIPLSLSLSPPIDLLNSLLSNLYAQYYMAAISAPGLSAPSSSLSTLSSSLSIPSINFDAYYAFLSTLPLSFLLHSHTFSPHLTFHLFAHFLMKSVSFHHSFSKFPSNFYEDFPKNSLESFKKIIKFLTKDQTYMEVLLMGKELTNYGQRDRQRERERERDKQTDRAGEKADQLSVHFSFPPNISNLTHFPQSFTLFPKHNNDRFFQYNSIYDELLKKSLRITDSYIEN
jgi:hypothetical protein